MAIDATAQDNSTATVADQGELTQAIAVLQSFVRSAGLGAVVVAAGDHEEQRSRTLLEALRDHVPSTVVVGLGDSPATSRVVADDSVPSHLTDLLGRIVGDLGGGRAGDAAEMHDLAKSQRPVTAKSVGSRGLAEAAPEQFEQLTVVYRQALVAALEQRAYRVSRGVAARVATMASDLALLRADPRDCIDVHNHVLSGISQDQPDALLAAAREESTMLLVELLGYLARTYRDSGVAGNV